MLPTAVRRGLLSFALRALRTTPICNQRVAYRGGGCYYATWRLRMTIGGLSRIDRTIEIKAPPERVWRAPTSAAELSAWFQGKIEGEISPGNEGWMTSVHAQHAGTPFRVQV